MRVIVENGLVRGFPYHDGGLDGVVLGPNEEVHIGLRSVEGERRVLTLTGVKAMAVDEFREGNIVLDISLFAASKLNEHTVLRDVVAQRITIKAELIPVEKVIFWLESSYGADVVAICDAVYVRMGALSVLSSELLE
jgi:hypothetical protein